MKSLKCSKCGLTNWSITDSCKGCGVALARLNAPSDSHLAQSPYLQGDSRNFAKYAPPLPDKNRPPASLGVLMIILGCLLLGISLSFAARTAKWPLYYPILGFSFIASGVVLCMREWFAVYVYLAGFAVATVFMFVTENMNMTEDFRKPLSRFAIPIILGLLMLNRMSKAKKSQGVGYAGQ